MVHSIRSDFQIIPEVMQMGINILNLMEECLTIGKWGEVMEYFGDIYTKQDLLYTIWGVARRYLDMGEYNYYVALMVTLKELFVRFGQANKG